jgi:CRP-like cAMP-binding protein
MAGARSKGDTILARLSRESFEQLLGNDLPLAVRLLRTMAGVLCSRSRELTDLLERVLDQPEGPTTASMDALARVLAKQVTWN